MGPRCHFYKKRYKELERFTTRKGEIPENLRTKKRKNRSIGLRKNSRTKIESSVRDSPKSTGEVHFQ